MQSPLAISRILLSRSAPSSSDALDSSSSEDGASPKQSAAYALAPPASNALPLLVRVRRARILAVTAAGATIVAAAAAVLAHGVTLRTVRADGPSASVAAVADALSDAATINAAVGAAAALSVQPLLLLVATAVPAALLCFAPDVALREPRAWRHRAAAVAASTLVLWLLGSGFHAANAHARLATTRAAINDQDLAQSLSTSPAVAQSSSSATQVAQSSTSSPDLDVRDTMLVTAIRPSSPLPTTPECLLPSPLRIPAQVAFGFRPSPWMGTLAPSALETTADNSATITLAADDQPTLPMAADEAFNLASLALRAADDFLRPQTTAVNASLMGIHSTDSTDSTDASALALTVRTALQRAVDGASHWRNVSVAEASLQLADLPVASSVRVQAATLELPLAASFLRRSLEVDASSTTTNVTYGGDNSSSTEFQINPKEECGRTACIVSPHGARPTSAAVDAGGQVRVLPLCLDASTGEDDADATMAAAADGSSDGCATRSTNAVLVLSLASRVEGEAIATASGGNASVVTLSNARKVLQVTVVRMQWTATDLAEQFAAECAASVGDCRGLAVPTASGGQVLVGEAALPDLSALAAYSPTVRAWTPLVASNAQEVDAGGALKRDLVFPRNFADASGWVEPKAAECEAERGAFLAAVERDHLFSERALQPAVLAGLFWLLQRGVVHELSSSAAASTSLAFQGSSTTVDIQLGVPAAAAALTLAGCAVLLLLAVAVFLFGRQREAEIERRFRPQHLARVLLDEPAFSRRLLQCNLLNVGSRFLASSELLEQFEIGGVALRHRAQPSDVLLVPGTASATASYLRAHQSQSGLPPHYNAHLFPEL